MAVGFKKNFFEKKVNKKSVMDEQDVHAITSGRETYAQTLSERGITFQQMHMMYIANVWVRVCVDKIVERIADVNPVIKPINNNAMGNQKEQDQIKKDSDVINEFLEEPNTNYESFTDINKKVARDVLKYDAGALELLRGYDLDKETPKPQIYAIPGNSVKLNVDRRGLLDKRKAYIQVDRGMTEVASWKPERMIYYKMNPQSNRAYGLSPMETLVQTVTAELYASQYNLDFFYNNATPRFAILMEGLGMGQGQTALNRIRNWWDQELQGKPHRPIIMGTEQGKIQIQKMGLTNDEMQFQQYSSYLLAKIMSIYKMQPIVLGIVGLNQLGSSSASTANIEEQTRQFKKDVMRPMLRMFWNKINKMLIHSPKYLNKRNVYVDFDLGIEDKQEQAEWHETYLRSGVLTINEIRTRGLGYQPVPWGNVPYLQNNLVPFGQGKNGAAVPTNGQNQDPGASQSEVDTITRSTSREDLKNILEKKGKDPVGWENMDVSDKIEIIEELIKERERFLTKAYMFPNNKTL